MWPCVCHGESRSQRTTRGSWCSPSSMSPGWLQEPSSTEPLVWPSVIFLILKGYLCYSESERHKLIFFIPLFYIVIISDLSSSFLISNGWIRSLLSLLGTQGPVNKLKLGVSKEQCSPLPADCLYPEWWTFLSSFFFSYISHELHKKSGRKTYFRDTN